MAVDNRNELIKIGLLDSLKIENTSMEKLQKLISETTNEKMKNRLQEHVQETNAQIQRITRRMQELGVSRTPEKVQAPDIMLPRSQVPMDGGMDPLKTSDNVKNGYAWENFEIAHYEFLKEESDKLDDKDTKKVAEENQKEEKDFANDVKKMIPDLVRFELP